MKNKLKFILLIIAVVASIDTCFGQGDILKYPIELKDGFGPFHNYAKFSSGIHWNDASGDSLYSKTFPAITGIPKNWTSVRQGIIILEPYQFIYQNYYNGNISQKDFDNIKRNLEWIPDTLHLTKSAIKCFVTLIAGYDDTGNKKIIIDTNNDYNLANDSIFTLKNYEVKAIDSLAKNAPKVTYQRKYLNKVLEDKVSVLVVNFNNPDGDYLLYSLPQYAVANVKTSNNLIETIYILSNSFTSISYSIVEIISKSNTANQKAILDSIVKKDQIITINKVKYKNLGVDHESQMLNLERIDHSSVTYSPQIGYYAPLFTGNDFLTHRKISLEKYRGKFLFIDFWGTWCTPCRAETSELKAAYNAISGNNRLSILGVAAHDTPLSLKNYIKMKKILWPQLLSNNIADMYKIISFPSHILINPEGKIIAENISIDECLKLIAKYKQ
jgi:thiol-disulfide isomerase/thioredoxin